MEQIAAGAEVAPQTVYNAFRTKHAVLEAVLDATIAGDTDPTALAERPWLDEIRAAEDGPAALDLLVDGVVAILERTSEVYRVMLHAAAEPEVGRLLQVNHSRRRSDQRGLTEALAAHRRSDMDPEAAADVFYALVNEEVFGFLVLDCGWPVPRFRDWLRSTLSQQLLAPDP
jgi:AcrR family transcriptional regulator